MEVWERLQEFAAAGWNLLFSLGAASWPLVPLTIWALFWLIAVDWVVLRRQLARGAWAAALALYVAAVIVVLFAFPAEGEAADDFLPRLDSAVVTITVWTLTAMIAGWLQLAGYLVRPRAYRAEESPSEPLPH